MFDEDVIRHIIQYMKESPEALTFDSYRDGESSLFITGTFYNSSGYNRDGFKIEMKYNESGIVTSINNQKVEPNTELQEAIKSTIIRNFKLKRKTKRLLPCGKS